MGQFDQEHEDAFVAEMSAENVPVSATARAAADLVTSCVCEGKESFPTLYIPRW